MSIHPAGENDGSPKAQRLHEWKSNWKPDLHVEGASNQTAAYWHKLFVYFDMQLKA